jgi:RsiW-degrading membrane proteinase PrsW (M82 family)
MLFGVAINEEICKAAVIFWLVRRPGSILMPQTVVLYGMISGLGFGIYEGVDYQQSVNRQQGVDTAYFLNIARLTSLPFLHAVWTGIAAYFIAFSGLVPTKRYGLWVVAIGIPSLMHAIYNLCGWNIIGLSVGFTSVILLMNYLSNCLTIQQQLKK